MRILKKFISNFFYIHYYMIFFFGLQIDLKFNVKFISELLLIVGKKNPTKYFVID